MDIAPHIQPPFETGQRLSRSIVWRWQRRFFEQSGLGAWRGDLVPHHITSSPFIADAYARVVLGFLRDCCAGPDPIDREQPIHVIELGAGSGRLGYLLVRRLAALLTASSLEGLRVRYVMTDFNDETIAEWRAHLWLQPLVESGQLDFARFDAGHDDSLTLAVSGETLAPGGMRNPVVVIANYVFDGMPQDAFRIEDGQLLEMLATITPRQDEPDRDDPAILSRAEIGWEPRPAAQPYYDDPLWNELLEEYRARLGTASVLFPNASLDCLAALRRLAGSQRMMVLSADRGYCRDEALLEGQGAPSLLVHGSFSMPVDYQLLGAWTRRQQGTWLQPARSHQHLAVCAFLFGDDGEGFREATLAYRQAIDTFGPDDFFVLKTGIDRAYAALSVEQIVAFLQLSAWDYRRFREALPVLLERAAILTDQQRLAVYETAGLVWDAYFTIGEEEDLAFEIGNLLLELGFHAEALVFFQQSAALYGTEAGTAYNMALCHYSLGDLPAARTAVEAALALAADYEPAQQLLAQIDAS